jgi:hypothetical protein
MRHDLGPGSREDRGEEVRFLEREQRGAFDPYGVKHDDQVIDQNLKGCHVIRGESLRATVAAPVDHEHARESR